MTGGFDWNFNLIMTIVVKSAVTQLVERYNMRWERVSVNADKMSRVCLIPAILHLT